eukprot:scpid91864/ scgid22193/ 
MEVRCTLSQLARALIIAMVAIGTWKLPGTSSKPLHTGGSSGLVGSLSDQSRAFLLEIHGLTRKYLDTEILLKDHLSNNEVQMEPAAYHGHGLNADAIHGVVGPQREGSFDLDKIGDSAGRIRMLESATAPVHTVEGLHAGYPNAAAAIKEYNKELARTGVSSSTEEDEQLR